MALEQHMSPANAYLSASCLVLVFLALLLLCFSLLLPSLVSGPFVGLGRKEMYFPVLVLSRFIGCRLCRRPLGAEERMLGSLSFEVCSRLEQTWHEFVLHFGGLGHLWCHLGWSLQTCGNIWARLGQLRYPNERFGIPVQTGAPI